MSGRSKSAVFYQCLLVLSVCTIFSVGAFSQTLNAVNALLTTKAIITMNAAVALDKQSPSAVAHAFLKANGLA